MNERSKIALITGGAVRIGRSICIALAENGYGIAVHYNHSNVAAMELVEQLKNKGCFAFAVQGDLRVKTECLRVIDRVYIEAGRLDVLVNNASVFHRDTLLTAGGDELMQEIDVNFSAPVYLSRAFARLHNKSVGVDEEENCYGKIINLLDSRIMQVDDESLPYSLSKKMLAEYTKESALAFAPGITVNGVAPGAILLPPEVAGKRVSERAGSNPLGYRCTIEDVAAAVLFFAESGAVTGQVIFVDGGAHLLTRKKLASIKCHTKRTEAVDCD